MEIGSEFWDIPVKCNTSHQFEPDLGYSSFLLSGRTALDFIIKDIKSIRDIKTVYMPSYCCHTMLKPLLDNEIELEFYEVIFKNGKFICNIDPDHRCDVVLIMQYFGFVDNTLDQVAKIFKDRDKLVIEDATHSWFSGKPYSKYSDYIFFSLRKWTGVPCGAVAIKSGSPFYLQTPSDTNMKYITLRIQAARLKKLYVEKHVQSKETFLSLFAEAEELLENDYAGYGIPNQYEELINAVDSNYIRQRRKLNAKFLADKLADCKSIKVAAITEVDTPLFVPIIVEEGSRDELKQFLINNMVYCPVHWPLTGLHRIEDNSLYRSELSLICDQRYTVTDMERLVELIRKFYGG